MGPFPFLNSVKDIGFDLGGINRNDRGHEMHWAKKKKITHHHHIIQEAEVHGRGRRKKERSRAPAAG